MPRRNKRNNNTTDDVGVEEKKGNKLVSILIGILIILVWLVIFAALIKFPDANDTEVSTDEYPYKNLAEAIDYIKDLEKQIDKYKKAGDDSATQIADLQAEVDRLKTFEDNQAAFEQEKQQYSNEVVFGASAIDYENYKRYYEEIEPDYAAELYKQVAQQYLYDEQYKDLAEAYTNMKPAKAAAALYEMTGNMDIIVGILKNMEADSRAKILNALSDLDAVYCAKITALLAP